MKKLGILVFIAALIIGLIFSSNCSVNKFKNMSGVQGSGTSKTEIRTVGEFKRIDASGAINVEVSMQQNFSLAVQADDNLLSNIKTEVNGDTLKIYSEDRISPKTDINVKVSMPTIEGLDVSGASSGIVSNLKSELLDLKASGASKINVEGEVQELNAEASGASSIDAGSLRAENAEVEASGASKATVAAFNNLDVNASGASKIVYIGEPKNIKQNSSGASSIARK